MTNTLVPRLEALLIEQVTESQLLNVDYITQLLRVNPSVYLYYPYLFAGLFGLPDSSTMDRLSIAGFLIYLHVLNVDSLVDTHDKNKIENFTSILTMNAALMEQATKILFRTFDDASPFWTMWYTRKKEFHSAVSEEVYLSRENFSAHTYSVISDKKSAFAKSAIDACYVLSGMKDTNLYSALLQSHAYFSLAYQICDDIIDIKKDTQNYQFNYAYFKGIEAGLFQSKDQDKDLSQFYFHPIASALYEEAISNYRRALDVLPQNTSRDHWKVVILNKIAETTHKIRIINDFKKMNDCSNTLSSTYTQHILSSDSITTRLSTAIHQGLEFLISRVSHNSQGEEYRWEEYITQAGISTIWASAFIGFQLKPLASYSENIFQTLTQLHMYLVQSKQDVWSFNEQWRIGDADTTNFALLFLNDSQIEKATIEKWFRFQQVDGGFSTYYNPQQLATSLSSKDSFSSFNGWCASHTCVSSIGAHILWKLQDTYQLRWKDVLNFLLNKQSSEGYWESYWWTSPIYSTYFCAKLLEKMPEHYVRVEKALEWIIALQNENGSFSDPFSENYFYTGLALKLLMINFECNKEIIQKTVLFLLSKQFYDGSWHESHALRVPSPDTISPPVRGYESIKTFGVNVRAREFQRLFTTSVCINALRSFECGNDLFI